MSPNTWTRCAGAAEIGPLSGRAVRVVEAQHVVSTRKLVDSTEEQEVLERLIETGKPPLPREPALDGLHYLLASSFRYPPLRHGSRFGTRAEPSLWYGALAPRTAFAETAYYRFVFLAGTAAPIARIAVDLTSFRVPFRTARGVDLGGEAFAAERDAIAAKDTYATTQPLGRDMRAAGVEAFLFPSARDAAGGTNVALFTPAAFGAKRPSAPRTWHAVVTPDLVEITRREVARRETFRFPRRDFEVDGRLPLPGLSA